MPQIQPKLPLSGVRVADFSRVVAGPYSTYLLARMGAEVIKIEGVAPLDHVREFGPFSDEERNLNRSGYFNSVNGGKQSVSLHLSDANHARLAREIALRSDLVVESFMTGVMERFGLAYESLAAEKPELVMVSCSGFGRTGPMKSHSAYMNTIAAYIGLTSLNSHEGGQQMPVGATLSDLVAGTSAALAALLALRTARATGRGQHIDLSMAEASMALMGEPFMRYFLSGEVMRQQKDSLESEGMGGVYPTAGADKWIAVSITNDQQWASLVKEMNEPDWANSEELRTSAGRLANRITIDTHLAYWTRQHENIELAQRLQRAGVPAVPSSDPEDIVHNPHFLGRGVVAVQDYDLEPGRLLPNLPWQFANHPSLRRSVPPPPRLGEHNVPVLQSLTSADATTIGEICEIAANAASALPR
jgi:crotonobetainyl-CoA:carnitine CoA-transferase CaiB-like acyl-CoA transferase